MERKLAPLLSAGPGSELALDEFVAFLQIGAAETDGHFTGFDDDRYLAPAVGMFQHARETLVVFQHIDILERNFAAGEILTGSRSIGSKILAEDENAITDH